MDSKLFEEFDYLDKDQKNQMLINMKSYINQLQSQVQELERSAIDIIIEKDEKILQLETLLNQQSPSKHYNKDEEILQLKAHITELYQKIDVDQTQHYEELQEIDRKWNSYLLEQIQLSSQDGQQQKIEMLESLLNLEKKNQKYDQELKIKDNQNMIDKNTISTLINKIQQLQDESQELNQQLIKMQRENDQQHEHFQSNKNALEIKINKLNILQNQREKQVMTLKTQNAKLIQTNKELLNQINELREQLERQTEIKDQRHSENYLLQQTANTIDQIQREEVNITAFEIFEESYEEKDQMTNLRQILDEKSEQIVQYEECIRQSTKQIKEQRAQLQLLQYQLKQIRQQQFNQKNLKEYIQALESDFLVSKQLLAEKADRYQEQMILLTQENFNLKQKVKCFQSRYHKKINRTVD
ncbi:unnamed protein product (macronuclear) [Paramecium tetraurelia]|uniref:Uncharacterized protein n=1 Tax=Paramecium tetraurelia TaxID=5888 RepID=A0D0U4_PARTE|nr:uncharacterized protein GSPATT00012213001 [Paramecium tetraurelia]CAK76661.1 unnamed protein product [Paramecium tetraurelia]|eukprot:XP_001444058.1 hypothetical protein (macronuclear) [Paramecium tetraurelia strain d4-2]